MRRRGTRCQGSTAQDWGSQATLGNLRPSYLLAHGGLDEDRRLEAEEWLRAPGCHPAPRPGEEGGKLHLRAGRGGTTGSAPHSRKPGHWTQHKH